MALTARARYFILDRLKSQARSLANVNTTSGGGRFWIVDRTNNLPVDEASSMYEARMALRAVQEPMP
jgi:hypothetical protein